MATKINQAQISAANLKRLEREARSMGLSVDQVLDRALLALADEIHAQRHADRSRAK
jgi:hypothetical protein